MGDNTGFAALFCRVEFTVGDNTGFAVLIIAGWSSQWVILQGLLHYFAGWSSQWVIIQGLLYLLLQGKVHSG